MDTSALIKENKIWLGYKFGDMAFKVPANSEPRETRYWQDETGQKWRSMGNVAWYTNLDHKKRHEDLILYKSYTPEEFPRYDNYDAINVDKTADIPYDYDGVMGVPITFLDKYNPEQFEIINRSGDLEWAQSDDCYFFTPPSEELQEKYKKHDRTWRVQNAYLIGQDNLPKTTYQRIFIRKKQ